MATHDFTTHGAARDGVTLDTAAVQRAIDTAHAEGGGVIDGERPGLVDTIQLDGGWLEIGRHTDWPMRRDLGPAADGRPHQPVVVPGTDIKRAADVRVRDCDVLWRGDRRGDYGSVLVARQTPGLMVEDVRGSAARPGLLDIDVDSAEPLPHAGSRPGGS